MHIPKGSIGFSTSKSSISWLIKWFTKSEWSHCFVTTGHMCDIPFLAEATFPRLRVAPLSFFQSKNQRFELWDIRGIDEEIKRLALVKLFSLIGTRYGTGQLITASIPVMLKKIGIKAGNPIGVGIVCSEFDMMFLTEIGFDLSSLKKNTVEPEDIYRIISAHKDCYRIAVSAFGTDEITYLETDERNCA